MKLHGEEVKVEDRVWDMRRGWGEVGALDAENTDYPICVRWAEDFEWFTREGKEYIWDETPTLFWQPIEFDIPKKPRSKGKAWQWICKSGNKYWLTHCYYASKDEVLERNSNTEPVEPYLPSEIEREVQE